ncbi:MAG: hypothetical protein UT24_C0005G0061 [Candidatus Woesebacteria bacterium GW2011_GWB1_39_12]|uniref:Rod shape-determining protein MreD n=2 Tax=Candidatus Woeseibacteriota TaxID=1752722 RepID=A0A0G0M406_9BACT|nr:MAG: hypothetical protein UT23_C0006G0083 [Candidatus Woesebacteria bacterium GW2011_GWA1_39_12]KKR01352.1 MAG: hypothetical protein UT24_C0005G0061 [Candidatus Woesebacteria bacterium GW2011_GWB1_39_12]
MKNPIYKILNTKYLVLTLLFLIAISERIAFDLGPNVELITATMILSSFYFGKKESFWLTFAIISLSDLVIGNSNIFLFTWSGFLIPAFLASSILKKLITNHRSPITEKISNIFSLTSIGFSANIFFYLWTNFGVWLLGNMYAKNLAGLLMSYFYALPFLKNQLASTLIFIPLGFTITELAISLNKKYQFGNKLNTQSMLPRQDFSG